MTLYLNRRRVMALASSGALLPFLPRVANAVTIENLSLFGPPAGPSVTLAHAVAGGFFDDIAETAEFNAWRNPDELRAGLTSGTIQLSVVPVQAAANLYNRGLAIRLANVMTNGLLYIASQDDTITTIPDLAGRRLAVPFRGDTPEILLNQLLAHHGLDPQDDLALHYVGAPVEAMQMLLAGRVDAALTTEPVTTAAILRARMAGKEILRAIDLQQAWGAMTGGPPILPQAGLAVTGGFLETNGDQMPAILAALAAATEATLADPATAAADATGALGMPAPLLAESIAHSNLVARPAAEARADIERMFEAMAGDGLEAIGGKLPDDAFYL